VALSTMEAEYMALSDVIRELTFIKRLLRFKQLNKYAKDPTTVNCDNQSAILMCKNPVFHKRSKHIDIRYHYAREQVEQSNVGVKYLRSEEMLADMLTKALLKSKHENCVKYLNLCNV